MILAAEIVFREHDSAVNTKIALLGDLIETITAFVVLDRFLGRQYFDQWDAAINAVGAAGDVFSAAIGTKRHVSLLSDISDASERSKVSMAHKFFTVSTNRCVMIRGRVTADPTTSAKAPHFIA